VGRHGRPAGVMPAQWLVRGRRESSMATAWRQLSTASMWRTQSMTSAPWGVPLVLVREQAKHRRLLVATCDDDAGSPALIAVATLDAGVGGGRGGARNRQCWVNAKGGTGGEIPVPLLLPRLPDGETCLSSAVRCFPGCSSCIGTHRAAGSDVGRHTLDTRRQVLMLLLSVRTPSWSGGRGLPGAGLGRVRTGRFAS
jgi:hypothetical protein